MNAREREAIASLINAFTQLQSTAAIRLQIAEALRQFASTIAVQIIDFKGHLQPERGSETVASSNDDLHRFIVGEYRNYLPEHALTQPHIWNAMVRERFNSVAAVSDRTGETDWRKCGFKDKFCRHVEIGNVGSVNLLGPDGAAQFAIYLPIFARHTFGVRSRQFYRYLAPYLSRGFCNLLRWDAHGNEAIASACGFDKIQEPLAAIRNGKLVMASGTALHLLGSNKQQSRHNRSLSQFLRIAPLARVTDEPVIWETAERETYRLLTMHVGNGLHIVRFVPVRIRRLQHNTTIKTALEIGLTERQSQVVGWLSQGLSDKQIAIEMGCTIHTVRVHLRAVFAKLHVNGRVEALNAVRYSRL